MNLWNCESCKTLLPFYYRYFIRFLCPNCHQFQCQEGLLEFPPFAVLEQNPLEENTLFGPYEIREALAEGGAARLYRVFHSRLQQEYALKVLYPSSLELYEEERLRFYLEFRSAVRLSHPQSIRVYEAGFLEPFHFFTLKLFSGESLADLLEKTLFSEESALEWGIVLAEILQEIHEFGMLHRDIKPENILVDFEGRPVLTDFGLVPDPDLDARLAHSGYTLGTPSYMSPEQALGDSLDARTDIYSLGIVLYQMVSATLPFDADSSSEVMDKVVHAPLPPLREIASVSQAYQTLLEKCCAKDKTQRFRNATELLYALRKLQQQVRSPFWKTLKKYTVLFILGLILFLLWTLSLF
jgi:serine/threonine protein kinase